MARSLEPRPVALVAAVVARDAPTAPLLRPVAVLDEADPRRSVVGSNASGVLRYEDGLPIDRYRAALVPHCCLNRARITRW
jgi:hypothetical protein